MVNQELRGNLPEEAVVFDNPSFDNSIIGTTTYGQVIYDYTKMIKELMADQGWSEDESIEWINYNCIRMLDYMPSTKPIIMISEIIC